MRQRIAAIALGIMMLIPGSAAAGTADLFTGYLAQFEPGQFAECMAERRQTSRYSYGKYQRPVMSVECRDAFVSAHAWFVAEYHRQNG